MQWERLGAAACVATVALGLAACGGGGGGGQPTSATPLPPEGSSGGGDPVSVAANTTYKVSSGKSVKRIVLGAGATLDNAGTVGGEVATAVEGPTDGTGPHVENHDGGSIQASDVAVLFHTWSATGLSNSGGARIDGGKVAVEFDGGGLIRNEGSSSIISSSNGSAIRVSGDRGDVENLDGATITSRQTAIYLGRGGHVNNAAGSTIEATGAADGDCGTVGVCAIYVPSAGQADADSDRALTLVNNGTIIGTVQMDPTATNSAQLSAGSTIRGSLYMGSNSDSSLNLLGDTGTVQLYSQAVTGATTFSGALYKGGFGTWIIDSNLSPVRTVVINGMLQVGNGGTVGSIGQGDVEIYQGSLVFDRSDDVVFHGSITGGIAGIPDNSATLVQAGSGALTLQLMANNRIAPTAIVVQHGTLQFADDSSVYLCGSSCRYQIDVPMTNDGVVVFDSNAIVTYSGAITGSGSLLQSGSGQTLLTAANTYLGGTVVNGGELHVTESLPGDLLINAEGAFDGYNPSGIAHGLPAVQGNLSNGGRLRVYEDNTTVAGDYTQKATGTLAVSLGSKLDVGGAAILHGGTLEVTGANYGYVANTRTEVLTASGGITGRFDQLVKDAGVVFTSNTINYDANSVWLDTTGLNVTVAAAGGGVNYTPASMGSAVRVQGAFQQLNEKIASSGTSGISADFLRSAGQFQQAPDLQAAQASLRSLSGELHAISAAITLKAIDASSRALSDRFVSLLDQRVVAGAWLKTQSVGGDMGRSGFDGIDYQLNGWLVGNDRRVGDSGVAGFALGHSRGAQWLNLGADRDNTRDIESMLYAGWLRGSWYTEGRVGLGRFQQEVSRQLLLGYSRQTVATRYNGRYGVAHGESGLYLLQGAFRLQPFASVEYARIGRDGFAEQGGGGFGLRSGSQILDRWQGALGVRASRHWGFSHARALDVSARALWQTTLASHGDQFDASFVGLQQWQPLVGIGLSRYSSLLGVDLDATLSPRTKFTFGYDYERGQYDSARTASAHLDIAF